MHRVTNYDGEKNEERTLNERGGARGRERTHKMIRCIVCVFINFVIVKVPSAVCLEPKVLSDSIFTFVIPYLTAVYCC